MLNTGDLILFYEVSEIICFFANFFIFDNKKRVEKICESTSKAKKSKNIILHKCETDMQKIISKANFFHRSITKE